jgi:glycosyltransferase involved in cell wall biosynthesis
MSEKVVVALNALINPGNAGGSESSALSILTNFRDAAPADVEMFVTALPPYVEAVHALRRDASKVIEWPWPEFTPISSEPKAAWARELRARLNPGALRDAFDRISLAVNRRAYDKAMPSKGEVDALLDKHRIDVAHFTYPVKWPTRRPYIFEPHDIQQVHFPEFFPPDILRWRHETYTDGIRNSAFVVCGTWWTKRDIMRHFGVSREKVAVIPRSSSMGRAKIEPAAAKKLAAEPGLPDTFMYYPAMTFPHKNHLRLLEAMAMLRDKQALTVNLVCTGRPYKPFHPTILTAIKQHGLQDQVKFLGRISEELLAVCYQQCKFIVFPSLLEGHSQSLLEALYHRKPIVAAKQSSIPETIGDAGHLFDALDVGSMAKAIGEAWTDPGLLARLHDNARFSFERYGWDRALVTLTACYKHAAGRKLSPEERVALDRALLEKMPEDG